MRTVESMKRMHALQPVSVRVRLGMCCNECEGKESKELTLPYPRTVTVASTVIHLCRSATSPFQARRWPFRRVRPSCQTCESSDRCCVRTARASLRQHRAPARILRGFVEYGSAKTDADGSRCFGTAVSEPDNLKPLPRLLLRVRKRVKAVRRCPVPRWKFRSVPRGYGSC